jgi:hypothetical protein
MTSNKVLVSFKKVLPIDYMFYCPFLYLTMQSEGGDIINAKPPGLSPVTAQNVRKAHLLSQTKIPNFRISFIAAV